jgi:hypothetical protein
MVVGDVDGGQRALPCINTTHAQDSQSKCESCVLHSIRKTSGRTTSTIRSSSADMIR